jgi:hypothetical protein
MAWLGVENFCVFKELNVSVGMALNLKVCYPQTVTYSICQQRDGMQKCNIIQFGY